MDLTWYESFFSGPALDLWRQAASPGQTRREVDYLEHELVLRGGARVLDVPCGHGRHAIELAARGYRTTGVDLSREEIEEATRRAEAAGRSVEWRHGDMRDLPWVAEFDAAFCFGNAFAYFDAAGTLAFLRAVARAIKPGARFALDYGMAAECVLPRFREREWMPIGDILFLEENRYRHDEGCVETTYTFARGGDIQTRVGLQWVFTVREIRTMLAEAGFTTRAIYRSIDRDPFELGAPCLYVVAEKPPAPRA